MLSKFISSPYHNKAICRRVNPYGLSSERLFYFPLFLFRGLSRNKDNWLLSQIVGHARFFWLFIPRLSIFLCLCVEFRIRFRDTLR